MNDLAFQIFSSPNGALLFDLSGRAGTLEFSTMRHGFGALTALVPMGMQEAYMVYDRPGLPHVRVSAGGYTAWEGRLEDVAIGNDGIRLGAFGYWRGYSDTAFTGSQAGSPVENMIASMIAFVSTANSFMSSSSALIQSFGASSAQVFEDEFPAQILDKFASAGDTASPPRLWETGVYEDQMLYFQPLNSSSRVWYVDAAELTIERTLDELWNAAYGLYYSGNQRTTTASTNNAQSVSRYGVTRRAAVRVEVDNSVLATIARDVFIQDRQNPIPRVAVIFNEVYDSGGGRYPLWVVRAGDAINIRNLPPNLSTDIDRIRQFYISETRYQAHTNTLIVTPESFLPSPFRLPLPPPGAFRAGGGGPTNVGGIATITTLPPAPPGAFGPGGTSGGPENAGGFPTPVLGGGGIIIPPRG